MKKAIIFLLSVLLSFAGCNNKTLSNDPLLNVILLEDWEQALELCNGEFKDSTTTEYNMLKGHVFLANNHNHEAINIFSSITSDGKTQWQNWTKKQLTEHPNSPVLKYLHADALARTRNYNEGINLLESIDKNTRIITKALVINSLALNYYKNEKESDKCIISLNKVDHDCDLAEYYNTKGYLLIKNRLALKGALESFIKSYELSKRNPQAIAGLIQISNFHLNDYSDSLLYETIQDYINYYNDSSLFEDSFKMIEKTTSNSYDSIGTKFISREINTQKEIKAYAENPYVSNTDRLFNAAAASYLYTTRTMIKSLPQIEISQKNGISMKFPKPSDLLKTDPVSKNLLNIRDASLHNVGGLDLEQTNTIILNENTAELIVPVFTLYY